MLARRACTMTDLCSALGLHPNHIIKELAPLLQTGQVRTRIRGDETYYDASARASQAAHVTDP